MNEADQVLHETQALLVVALAMWEGLASTGGTWLAAQTGFPLWLTTSLVFASPAMLSFIVCVRLAKSQ